MRCPARSNTFIYRLKNTHLALFGTALNLYLQETINCSWWVTESPKTWILHPTGRSREAVEVGALPEAWKWEPSGFYTQPHCSPVPIPIKPSPCTINTSIISVFQAQQRSCWMQGRILALGDDVLGHSHSKARMFQHLSGEEASRPLCDAQSPKTQVSLRQEEQTSQIKDWEKGWTEVDGRRNNIQQVWRPTTAHF